MELNIFDMLHRLFSCLFVIGMLAMMLGTSAFAQRGVIRKLDKEFAALAEARTLLLTIKDEKTAELASEKITRIFDQIGPHFGNRSWGQVDKLATAQNHINRIMKDLMKEEYFEKAKLQVLWTLMTDPESRRMAIRRFN